MSDEAKAAGDWLPEQRALAAQWLIVKRLDRIREGMPPDVFVGWAQALELLLRPTAMVAGTR